MNEKRHFQKTFSRISGPAKHLELYQKPKYIMNIPNLVDLPQVKRENLYDKKSPQYLAAITLPDSELTRDLIATTKTLGYLERLSRINRFSERGKTLILLLRKKQLDLFSKAGIEQN